MATDGTSVSGMSEKCLIAHDGVMTISGPELIKSTAESKPNEAGVRRVCLWMMVLSALLIALMLIISHYEQSSAANGVNDSQSVAGWVAVAGAAIIFGSTGERLLKSFSDCISEITYGTDDRCNTILDSV